jgi:hypothetical protein
LLVTSTVALADHRTDLVLRGEGLASFCPKVVAAEAFFLTKGAFEKKVQSSPKWQVLLEDR